MVTEPAHILLGDVEVTRVPEYAGKSLATPGFLFPDSRPAYWADNVGWLDPDFYDATKGTLRTVLHTWLIRSQGMIFPGHFGGHSACRVDDDGDGAFIIRDWADLARI
jgi:hypothetical protein